MKKKLAGLLVAGVAVFALSGCGGGGGDDGYIPPPPAYAVDIDDLHLGYAVGVYSYDDGYNYRAEYCFDNYTVYNGYDGAGAIFDRGTFYTAGTRVIMLSQDFTLPSMELDSYPTSPYELIEGYNYDILNFYWSRININYIEPIICP